MKKLLTLTSIMLTALLPMFFIGCELTPSADGIVIYTGSNILSNRGDGKGTVDDPFEIVAKRAQQLSATTTSGGVIVWESSNAAILEVDQTGLIRVGQALGKKATVSAFLRDNPDIKAEVTFIVRDLR
jgi:hypothetical protein